MNTHFGTLTISRPFAEGFEIINFQDVLSEVGLTGEVLDGGHGTAVNPWETSVFPGTTRPILFKNDDGLHGVNIMVGKRPRLFESLDDIPLEHRSSAYLTIARVVAGPRDGDGQPTSTTVYKWTYDTAPDDDAPGND